MFLGRVPTARAITVATSGNASVAGSGTTGATLPVRRASSIAWPCSTLSGVTISYARAASESLTVPLLHSWPNPTTDAVGHRAKGRS